MVRLRRVLFAAAIVLMLSSMAFGQSVQDACNTAIGPFTVTSGSPFYVLWTMDATVPASPTDPTPVPHRVDGFYLQIDTQTRVDIAPTRGTACPSGSPQAGKIPYIFRTTSGVARGSHTARIQGWNFAVDQDGNPTTVRQEGAVTSIPFAAVDLVQTGPPTAPTNGSIRR